MKAKYLLNRAFGAFKGVLWSWLLIAITLAVGLAVYYRIETKPDDLPPGNPVEVESEPHNPIYEIGGFDYDLEVVDTPEERQQGLSDRTHLPPRKGMLFVFQEADDYGIWMKDMNFPLDIIWLDSDQQVVGLEENVQPDSYPESFRADASSLYIIEINSGEATKAGLEIGDTISCQQTREQKPGCFPNSSR